MRELDQALINKISEITYKDTYIYRFMLEKMILIDSKEELINNSAFCGVNEPIKYMPASVEMYERYLKPYYEELPSREVLFVGGMFRKNINGELYHTAMDPYIDVLNSDSYVMVEPVNDMSDELPVHTSNTFRILRSSIVGAYGTEETDTDELREFMRTSFFSVIEDYYGEELPEEHKESVVSNIQWTLAMRNAYRLFYTAVLNRISPRIVCYSHGASRNCCYLYEAAHELSIPCIEIDHGAVIRTRDYPEHARGCDLYVSFSDVATEMAHEAGVLNVRAVGKPGILQIGESYMGESMPATVVCVISSCEKDLLNKACIISSVLPPDKFVVMYKKHSTEQWTDLEEKQIKEEYPGLQIMDFAVDVNEIFKISHVIIGERSSALLEAIPYDHIKILINKRGDDDMLSVNGKMAFFAHVIDNGEMIPTETVDDMLEEILSYDRTGNYRPNGDIYWAKDAERKFVELIDEYI